MDGAVLSALFIRALRALSHFDSATTHEIANASGDSYQTTRRQLILLLQCGYATRSGHQYAITRAGRSELSMVTDVAHHVEGDVVSSEKKLALQKAHRDEKRAAKRCVNEWSRPHLVPRRGRTKCDDCLRYNVVPADDPAHVDRLVDDAIDSALDAEKSSS